MRQHVEFFCLCLCFFLVAPPSGAEPTKQETWDHIKRSNDKSLAEFEKPGSGIAGRKITFDVKTCNMEWKVGDIGYRFNLKDIDPNKVEVQHTDSVFLFCRDRNECFKAHTTNGGASSSPYEAIASNNPTAVAAAYSLLVRLCGGTAGKSARRAPTSSKESSSRAGEYTVIGQYKADGNPYWSLSCDDRRAGALVIQKGPDFWGDCSSCSQRRFNSMHEAARWACGVEQ